jgi:hypothetical protein
LKKNRIKKPIKLVFYIGKFEGAEPFFDSILSKLGVAVAPLGG